MSSEKEAIKALGERIGYGRVIQHCEELWPPPSKPWTVLERENLNAKIERLQKVVVDQALTIGTLKDTIARQEQIGSAVAAIIRTEHALRHVQCDSEAIGDRCLVREAVTANLTGWEGTPPPPAARVTFPPSSGDFGQIVAVSLHESITGEEDPEPGAAP